MLLLYYKPHKSRLREAVFVEHLKNHFPTAKVIHENAAINPKYLDLFVDRDELLAALEKDRLLPPRAKQKCIEALYTCPAKLKVAREATRVSFDTIIEKEGKRYYWEFHEKQYKDLAVPRIKDVFTPSGESVKVPRYLQRLVRDVWRMKHFQPYTIVWHDWFDQNYHSYKPSLRDGLHEFSMPSKFSFKNFLGIA